MLKILLPLVIPLELVLLLPLRLLPHQQLLLLQTLRLQLVDPVIVSLASLAAMILLWDLLASTLVLIRAPSEVAAQFSADSKNMELMEPAELLVMIWFYSIAAITSCMA